MAASADIGSFPELDGGDQGATANLSDGMRSAVFNPVAETATSKSVNDVFHAPKEMNAVVNNMSASHEFRSVQLGGTRIDGLEPDLPEPRAKLETRSRPLTSFEDAMKLPYNQDCLRPLFGPGMSQRAWDSGKFNIELHCIDPWMKKNWRRFRNMCKGGKEGGVKFNQLRRNFMRMLWFEKKGIHIDWKTVDVSSRLVSEQRGPNEPIGSNSSGSRIVQRVERRRKRQRCVSPALKGPCVSPASKVPCVSSASKAPPAAPKRQGIDAQAGAQVSVTEEDENRMASLVGMRALQEAGLVIMKQEDLSKTRSDSCRDREEIGRLRAGLETEKCLRLATESRRQDDFARMHSEGCHDRDEIHRLKMEIESLKRQVIASEASRTEVLLNQASEIQQRRDRNSSSSSCSICQKDFTVFPTMSPGCCKCQFHIHCFWKHFAANGVCSCGKSYPDLLYTYFGRLSQIGTRPGVSEGLPGQRVEKDESTEDGRAVEIQKVKGVVRELLQEWHVAGGRNGWHLHNLSDSMRLRFDAFHADLLKRAQALGGHKAREVLSSYANKFGLSTGNFTMLYPGLDVPEELVDSHGTGGSNFSDESETQARGPIYVSEDGEENDEYRKKMEMIIRATSLPSDHEARSEIEDSTVGFSKRRRK